MRKPPLCANVMYAVNYCNIAILIIALQSNAIDNMVVIHIVSSLYHTEAAAGVDLDFCKGGSK